MEQGVEQAVRGAIETFRSLGAETKDVSLPHTGYACAVYYLVATAEASSNLARYDGVHFGLRAPGGSDIIGLYGRTRKAGFGEEVKRRIMLGTYALSAGYYDAYYLKALKVRTLLRQDFDAAFGEVDLILAPTSPTVAFKLGEKTADPLSMYLSDIFTISINLAGVPAVSIPCGFSDGLPVGLQIIARDFEEAAALRAVQAFQGATDFHRRRPGI